jgi:hypothetical protein
MSKVKTMMMEKAESLAFQQMQKALFEELVQHGSPNTGYKPLNPFALGGAGLNPGNNSFSPLEIEKARSAAFKQETLILNARAKPNITTKVKKPKATPYTKAHEAGNFLGMNSKEDFNKEVNGMLEQCKEKTAPKDL